LCTAKIVKCADALVCVSWVANTRLIGHFAKTFTIISRRFILFIAR
jgi:hypothetical protein